MVRYKEEHLQFFTSAHVVLKNEQGTFNSAEDPKLNVQELLFGCLVWKCSLCFCS